MWKNFLKWLLKFALERLGEDVDAESQKQLDEYNRKRDEVEARRVAGEKELERIENERLQLLGKRVTSSHEIESLQKQINEQDETLEKLRNEKEQKLTDIRNLSDDDVLRSDLPGAS